MEQETVSMKDTTRDTATEPNMLGLKGQLMKPK